MSDKWKVDQSGFQLDKKELEKDAPMMIRPIEDAAINWLNAADFDKNHIADISQYGPTIIKMLPLIVQLAPLIDTEKAKEWFAGHDWVKDEEAVKEILHQVLSLAKTAKP